MSPPKPKVVLLALSKLPSFDIMHSKLLDALRSNTSLLEVTTEGAADILLNGIARPIVLVVDSALTEEQFASQRAAAISFVHRGGTLIFVCDFVSNTSFSDMTQLFADFSLPWTADSSHRKVNHVNAAALQMDTSRLLPFYSPKAVLLAKVQPSNIIYSATSRTDEMVYIPEPVNNQSLTSTALGKVGRGRVGYVGDVGRQGGTLQVIMTMCGLRDR
ncbi:hypothetical protein M409DRAFT_30391 [Zasmidium cellare ATCC 36951]|uniref:Uncharacterized protein n=1 Tax=Zasmidium cellare ATCC 36951 TaxID=1080233 RepID=A0A6A6BYW9_ZASCE|nr:uncharacterized protein M409DRAFT_30391 [Zasmidium cellare ATCC 36951]KAF2159110.1 hypothetical protein M409DRAFT_30391 [Zasmidium cellare ATCC 36951]